MLFCLGTGRPFYDQFKTRPHFTGHSASSIKPLLHENLNQSGKNFTTKTGREKERTRNQTNDAKHRIGDFRHQIAARTFCRLAEKPQHSLVVDCVAQWAAQDARKTARHLVLQFLSVALDGSRGRSENAAQFDGVAEYATTIVRSQISR